MKRPIIIIVIVVKAMNQRLLEALKGMDYGVEDREILEAEEIQMITIMRYEITNVYRAFQTRRVIYEKISTPHT